MFLFRRHDLFLAIKAGGYRLCGHRRMGQLGSFVRVNRNGDGDLEMQRATSRDVVCSSAAVLFRVLGLNDVEFSAGSVRWSVVGAGNRGAGRMSNGFCLLTFGVGSGFLQFIKQSGGTAYEVDDLGGSDPKSALASSTGFLT
jgi:hypothetical protein